MKFWIEYRKERKRKKMMTQNEQVLNYMKEHGGITSMDAFNNFGITRLSGRIYDLRGMGYSIKSEPRKSPNRYGVMTNYTEYQLEEK